MSEFKGTKEEWKLDGNIIYADDYFQTYIATIPNSYYAEKREANALLISKAAEMLEMLKECKLQLEYLNEKFTETGTTNSFLSKIEQLIKQATEV